MMDMFGSKTKSISIIKKIHHFLYETHIKIIMKECGQV